MTLVGFYPFERDKINCSNLVHSNKKGACPGAAGWLIDVFLIDLNINGGQGENTIKWIRNYLLEQSSSIGFLMELLTIMNIKNITSLSTLVDSRVNIFILFPLDRIDFSHLSSNFFQEFGPFRHGDMKAVTVFKWQVLQFNHNLLK